MSLSALVVPFLLPFQLVPGAPRIHEVPAEPPAASAPAPGNVLVVVLDDVGVDMIGAYAEGGEPAPTPVLDALAQQGVLFRNAWSEPVCSPTRAALLTGRHPFRTGIGFVVDAKEQTLALPLEEVTLPEMLALGTGGRYASAAFGKWHLGNDSVGGALAPNLAGFDHFDGALSNFYAPQTYTSWLRTVDGVTTTASGYATSVTVDAAAAWLQGAPEPFFCYVAFNASHQPFHAPPAALHGVDLSTAGPPASDPVPYYRAMVSATDTEIGRLLGALSPAAAARTTVIVVGDNGTPGEATVPPFVPAHAKGTLYEGGINVPLLVRGPQVAQPGSESLALVGVTDVFATAAGVAGVDLAAVLPGVTLDGLSLLPYLADPAAPSKRKVLYAELFHPNGQPAAVPALGSLKAPATICQQALGYASPTGPQLQVCGAPLYDGAASQLTLTGSSPFTNGLLFSSAQFAPMPSAGGALVPSAGPQVLPFSTDAAGVHVGTVWGGTGELTLYYQALVSAPGLVPPFVLSNAVAVALHGTDIKAVRDVRYKLIFHARTGATELYDLRSDPFERTDLLAAGPLAADAAAHHASLMHEMLTLAWGMQRSKLTGGAAKHP